jgi:hypothetical protein
VTLDITWLLKMSVWPTRDADALAISKRDKSRRQDAHVAKCPPMSPDRSTEQDQHASLVVDRELAVGQIRDEVRQYA